MIELVLYCPSCHLQHVDHPWIEPHRSHRCGNCFYVWRPSDEPSRGVPFVTTRGPEDSALLPQPMIHQTMPCPQDF